MTAPLMQVGVEAHNQVCVPVKDADVVSDEDASESGQEECAAGVPSKSMTSDLERPCKHNQWKKQTKKRGKLVLRCSVCCAVWKTRPELHQKCASFHAGRCQLGDNCPHPHIYARRETASLARRKARLAQEESTDVPIMRQDLFSFYPVQLPHNIMCSAIPQPYQMITPNHPQLPPLAPCVPIMQKHQPTHNSESDGECSDTSVPISQASNSSGSLMSTYRTPFFDVSTPVPLQHSATGAEPYPYQLQYDMEDNLTPCRVQSQVTPSTPQFTSQEAPKVWVGSTWTHSPYCDEIA